MITAYDGTDEQALDRRMQARPAHIELGDKLRRQGILLYGVAIMDETGKMVGSVLVGDFTARAGIDAWLAIEPYVTGKVWEKIEVRPCKVGPSFVSK